ncbi:DUF4623 domain-containing protein [Niabella aquatica]
MMKHISKYRVMIVTLAAMLLVISCQKKYPGNVDSPDEVVLKSIRIVNAGANGGTILEGVIDESRKTISFPYADTMTDFSKVKLEAEMSSGASLEKAELQFDFKDGAEYFIESKTSLTQIIKVINNKRFREYSLTLRTKVPPFGADFEKPQIYDYTSNPLGNPLYPSFTGAATRGSGFDGEHVLVVTRASGGSHLLKVSDLKNNVINPIPLNLTGVSGGTFPVNVGAQINGHTYIANLSGNSAASPLKIYYWTDPSAPPQLLWSAVIPDGGVRLGDNMSANLDENGNGYFYFGDNAATRLARLKVTNYTQISDPVAFMATTGQSYMMGFNRVANTPDYIYKGYLGPVRVANESAAVSYSLSNTAVPERGTDAHVINFNRERYLVMTTAARSGAEAAVLYVYNITKGKTTTEALEEFNGKPAADRAPIYEYPLFGAAGPNCFLQTRWHITKDTDGRDLKLTVYSAYTDAGFVVIDFPIKSLDE